LRAEGFELFLTKEVYISICRLPDNSWLGIVNLFQTFDSVQTEDVKQGIQEIRALLT